MAQITDQLVDNLMSGSSLAKPDPSAPRCTLGSGFARLVWLLP